MVVAEALTEAPERVSRPSSLSPVRHPGWLIQDALRLMDVSVSEAAARMGIPRASLYRVFAGQAPVTAELALRFTRLTGGTPQFYLEMQNDFDIWRTRSLLKDELANIHPLRYSGHSKR